MAKSDIWMPLYPGDYLRDTMHLSTEEHGAYLLLLMSLWAQGGQMSADSKQLARRVLMPLERWQAIEAIILEFFTVVDGVLTHNRVSREIERAQQQVTRAKDGGKARMGNLTPEQRAELAARAAGARWKNASGMPAECQPDASRHAREDASGDASKNAGEGEIAETTPKIDSKSPFMPAGCQPNASLMPAGCQPPQSQSQSQSHIQDKDSLSSLSEGVPESITAHQVVIQEFNAVAPVRCTHLTDKRRKAMAQRLRDRSWNWRAALDRIPDSDFLSGRAGNWKGCTIDFFLRPDTVTRILEGAFDNGSPQRKPPPASQQQFAGYTPNSQPEVPKDRQDEVPF